MNIILLFGCKVPYLTLFKYDRIYYIFSDNPLNDCNFKVTFASIEFKLIYLIYLNKCSTPISYGSYA